MKYLIFTVLIFGGSLASLGQTKVTGSENIEVLSLQECIQYAIKNNVSLRQSDATAKNSENTLEQSKFSKYPTVNGSYNLNGNAGRNVDPFSNSIVTNAIGTNNLGVGAGMVLFDGYRIKNTVELNKLNLEAALMDVQSSKNNVSLQVALAYLNVLSTEDLIEVSQKQIEVTRLQLDRTQKLVNGGMLPETNLFDLDAQLANDELNLVNAENNHESAILTLKQAINAPSEMNLRVSRISLPNPSILAYNEKASDVYNTAVGYLPEVKAGTIRMKAADKNIDLAKALGMPTVSLNTSWGTAYSSVAKKLIDQGSTSNPIAVSADFQGQTIPFVINFPQQNFDRVNIPYFNQLGNNQNLNLGLAVRVPIFNGFNKKFRTQGAEIQKMQVELQNESIKLQIRQDIDLAYINMLNAQKRFTATQAQVEALEKSFRAADSRFSAGSSTFVDYNLAKTNLDRSKSNLVVAKYDYIFRIKILDFYQNKPLEF